MRLLRNPWNKNKWISVHLDVPYGLYGEDRTRVSLLIHINLMPYAYIVKLWKLVEWGGYLQIDMRGQEDFIAP